MACMHYSVWEIDVDCVDDDAVHSHQIPANHQLHHDNHHHFAVDRFVLDLLQKMEEMVELKD